MNYPQTRCPLAACIPRTWRSGETGRGVKGSEVSPKSASIPVPAPVPTQPEGTVGQAAPCSPVHRLPGVSIAAQGFGRDPQQRGQQQRARRCHEAAATESVERPRTAGSRGPDSLPLKSAGTWVKATPARPPSTEAGLPLARSLPRTPPPPGPTPPSCFLRLSPG